jgi:hypothetical protein
VLLRKLNSTTAWTGMESIAVMRRGGHGTNIRVLYKDGDFFMGGNGMNLRVPHK